MGRVASIFRKEIPMLNVWLSFLKILLHTRLHGVKPTIKGSVYVNFYFRESLQSYAGKKKVPPKRQIFGFNYKIRNATN